MSTATPRRALHRRRPLLVAGGLAAVAAIVGGWLLVGPGSMSRTVATDPLMAIASPDGPFPSHTADRVTLPPAAVITSPPQSEAPVASPTSSGPTPRPIKVPTTRTATRVVVADLGIDLPVMRQTTPYPACGVAMYIVELDQPGSGPTGATYLYAHAQTGLFLPLLRESLVNDGLRMLGMLVDVYTGDNLRFTYRITEVRRHVTSMDAAFDWAGPESVWLQTSEGQGASVPKLQVVGEFVSRAAADAAASHPEPHPVSC